MHVFYCSRSKTNIASAGVEPGLTFQLFRYSAGFPFQRTRVQTPAKPIFVSVTHAMHDVRSPPHTHRHNHPNTHTENKVFRFSEQLNPLDLPYLSAQDQEISARFVETEIKGQVAKPARLWFNEARNFFIYFSFRTPFLKCIALIHFICFIIPLTLF